MISIFGSKYDINVKSLTVISKNITEIPKEINLFIKIENKIF